MLKRSLSLLGAVFAISATSALAQPVDITVTDAKGKAAKHHAQKQHPSKPGGQPMTVDGTLLKWHEDVDSGGVHSSRWHNGVLRKPNDQVEFNVDSLPENVKPGSKVRVRGKSSDGKNAATAKEVDPESVTILQAPQSLAAPSTRKILFIIGKYSDQASDQEWSQSTAAQTGQQLAQSYLADSYGNVQLQVTVTPPLVTTHASGGCDWSGMGSAMDVAAAAAGFPNTGAPSPSGSWYTVVYLLPGSSCGWAGLGYVGYGKAYINGSGNMWSVKHEVGHTFGNTHSGSVGNVGPGQGVSEYGDNYDVMGNGRTWKTPNAWQKANRMGFLPTTVLATADSTKTGTFTIDPIEDAGGKIYAVLVPTPGNPNRTFIVENHRTDAGNEVQLRLASPFESSSGSDDTQLFRTLAAATGGTLYADATVTITVGPGNTQPPAPPPTQPPPAAGPVQNPSFEAPATQSYVYNPTDPTTGGWTFSAGSGVQRNGSAWSAPAAVNGVQTAFLQGGGSIAQTMTLKAGSYTLSFYVANRTARAVGAASNPVAVSLDGTLLQTVTPSSGAFSQASVPLTIAADGQHTIMLAGTVNTPGYDVTSFIDSVSVQ